MRDRIRLPLRFDAAAMQADLRRIEDAAWVRHFVTQNYEGDWTVLALRASATATHPVQMIYSDPSCDTYVDTPLLAACPALGAALAAFDCPLESVRLMRLGAGSIIKTHTDHDLDVEHGRARLHIPIETNPDVDFRLNDEQVVLGEGECWYLRLSDPHSVANRGTRDRIHLVIDAIVSPWLHEQLARADASTPEKGDRSLYPSPKRGQVPFSEPDGPSRGPGAESPEKGRSPEKGDRSLYPSSKRGQARPEKGDRSLYPSSKRGQVPFSGPGDGIGLPASGVRLPAWVPASVRPDGIVEWCELGDVALTDPFFEDTIRRAKRNSRVVETPLDVLLTEAAAHPGVAPSGFIFHCSRCGSTLMSQLARALPGTVVLSEAPAIDDVLRSGWTDEARAAALRSVVTALGQPRAPEDRHLIIKFDAWHVLDAAFIQSVFPDVPSVFVYRDPADVIASQMRMPSQYLLPGVLDPAIAGLASVDDVIAAGREAYCARVLARILAAAAELAADARLDVLNYRQLPSAGIDRVLAWTGRQANEADRARLVERAAFDAKTPGMPFAAAASPRHISATIRAAAAAADAPFAALERLNTARR